MEIDMLRHMVWSLINLVFYPLVTILLNVHLVYRLVRYSYVPGMLQESVLRRCNEAFIESMAQFCIQLMILIVTWPIDDNVETSQILSIITSFLSISSGSASWFCLVSGNDKPDVIVTVSLTLLYGLILAPRLMGAALMVAYQRQLGVIIVVSVLLVSFLLLLVINRRWDSRGLKSRKEVVIHSMFDSIACCSFIGHIFWGNTINVAFQSLGLLILPILIIYDINPLHDCTIPFYSRGGFYRNSTLNSTCRSFLDVCWNKSENHFIYPLDILKCNRNDESYLFCNILIPTLLTLILTLIPAKIIDSLEETQKTNTWLEGLERGFKGFLSHLCSSKGEYNPTLTEQALDNDEGFVIKCNDSNLVIECGLLGVHLREPRNVDQQKWMWKGNQLLNKGRKIPLCVNGEYSWTFLCGTLIGRRTKCALTVVGKQHCDINRNGQRLDTETSSIENVQFWESNGINNTFFGNSKSRFLLPSFSANSELIFLGAAVSNPNQINEDYNIKNLEVRSVLLPLWFKSIEFSPCDTFNESIVVVNETNLQIMKSIGRYEEQKIEYFEENGEKYLQGVVTTHQGDLFIAGGRLLHGHTKPRSTQILTTATTWKPGPEIPEGYAHYFTVMPIILRCGTTYIFIEKHFNHAFQMEGIGGDWLALPSPIIKRYEFGSFIIKRTLYIVGGHINVKDDEEHTQEVSSCECLDLDEPERGWKMIGNLTTLLWSTNTILGPTFATTISDDTAIVGGLNSGKLFLFRNSKFSLIEGDKLQYDAFNMRHHKLVKWPFND